MAETVQILSVDLKVRVRIAGDDGAMLIQEHTYLKNFTNGTGTDQVGNAWNDNSRALNTTSEDLDLGAGGLTDFQGADVALNNVKVLLFENLDTDSGDGFLIKQGSTNPITTILGGTSPTLTVGPGGLCLLVNPIDGYAVTNGTADVLAVQAQDNSTYKILIAGDNA